MRSNEIAQKYEIYLSKKLEDVEIQLNNNIEIVWNSMKNVIPETVREVCGISRKLNHIQQTAWLTIEIRKQIKITSK